MAISYRSWGDFQYWNVVFLHYIGKHAIVVANIILDLLLSQNLLNFPCPLPLEACL